MTSRGSHLARASVVVWAAGCIVLAALLLARHLLTLPTPVLDSAVLHRAIASQRSAEQRGRWLVLHVLYDDCACSGRILTHLRQRGRPTGVAEQIVYVTEHPPVDRALAAELGRDGFALDVVTPDQLRARYELEAAPLLVIADPGDTVRYLGGYTRSKQAADIRDLGVIAMTRAGFAIEPLPVFGCAVGEAMRAKLNPFGIASRN